MLDPLSEKSVAHQVHGPRVGEGEELFAALLKFGLEGMVGKRLDSSYVGGRTRDWLKMKTRTGKQLIQNELRRGTIKDRLCETRQRL